MPLYILDLIGVALDRHPVFWLDDPAYLVVILVAALLTLAYVRVRRIPRNALAIEDAVGLAVFTIGGAQVAERAGMWPPVVVLMATMTGVAGAILRGLHLPVVAPRNE